MYTSAHKFCKLKRRLGNYFNPLASHCRMVGKGSQGPIQNFMEQSHLKVLIERQMPTSSFCYLGKVLIGKYQTIMDVGSCYKSKTSGWLSPGGLRKWKNKQFEFNDQKIYVIIVGAHIHGKRGVE